MDTLRRPDLGERVQQYAEWLEGRSLKWSSAPPNTFRTSAPLIPPLAAAPNCASPAYAQQASPTTSQVWCRRFCSPTPLAKRPRLGRTTKCATSDVRRRRWRLRTSCSRGKTHRGSRGRKYSRRGWPLRTHTTPPTLPPSALCFAMWLSFSFTRLLPLTALGKPLPTLHLPLRSWSCHFQP